MVISVFVWYQADVHIFLYLQVMRTINLSHKHSMKWAHSKTHALFHHTLHHYGMKYRVSSHLHNLGAKERGLERPQPPDCQQTNSAQGSHGERHMYVQANKYEINVTLSQCILTLHSLFI